MKIYISMISDRHSDPVAYPFSTPEAAIDYARDWAHKHSDEVKEPEIDGLLYYAVYNPEGDFVWVVEQVLDSPK